MPVYVKGGHEVTVSGEEAVAQFEAAGYSLAQPEPKPEPEPTAKRATRKK